MLTIAQAGWFCASYRGLPLLSGQRFGQATTIDAVKSGSERLKTGRRFSEVGLKSRAVWPVCLLAFFVAGFLIPEKPLIPVQGATPSNWIAAYFWDCPWCEGDRIHYGIDILAPEGRPILSATHGLVLYDGWMGAGGESLLLLGPKWRLHYYGHLSAYRTESLALVARGQVIGLVGNTGRSDRPHLHYNIISLAPYPWLYDADARQGWKKMFVLNPDRILKGYAW